MSTPTRDEAERAMARSKSADGDSSFVRGCDAYLRENGYLTRKQVEALSHVRPPRYIPAWEKRK